MAGQYRGVQLHNGKLRIWFKWNGKQTFEPLYLNPTPTNWQAAARLRDEIYQKIKHGMFSYADYFPESIRAQQTHKATFGQCAEAWISCLTDRSAGTVYGYKNMLNNYLMPHLKDKPINQIKYSDLAVLLANIDVSPKTRNNILTPIRQIFEIAYIDGLIQTNPASKLKSSKNQKAPPDPLTLDEVQLILTHLKKHYPEPICNYFELAFFGGFRPSELISLKWADIDWNQRTVRIQRAKVLREIKSTKTYKVRDVEINSRMLAALNRQKQHTFVKTEWVLLNPNTDLPFQDERSVRRWAWIPTLKKLGIRHRAAYQTRHTCATIMLMSGNNPAWAAKQLGHSIEMFFRTYSRWIDGQDKGRELSKIEELIGAKK